MLSEPFSLSVRVFNENLAKNKPAWGMRLSDEDKLLITNGNYNKSVWVKGDSGSGWAFVAADLEMLRTPISAKYCWFGWWLGAWSTPSHDPTQLCDIYISGYKYTLISEWTRLFGLLRILDNLISGAVCYFCMTISVFCEIYTLRMRVVAHAAIVWVGWFLCRRPELG